MKTVLSILAGCSLAASSFADIIINEVSSSSSERNLYQRSDGVRVLGSTESWYAPDFDRSLWAQAPAPFGFGYPQVVTDLTAELGGEATAAYFVREFQVDAAGAASVDSLSFDIDAGDGFVAYLNGEEIARSRLGGVGSFIYRDQLAYQTRDAGTYETVDLGEAGLLLIEGTNVLAVQLHKAVAGIDRGTLFRVGLRIESSPATILLSESDTYRYFAEPWEPSGGVVDPEYFEEGPLDWVELHNTAAVTADISGWSLSDDPDLPQKYVFPAGTEITGGGYLVICASGLNLSSSRYLHSNFKLNSDGEYLGLLDAGGLVIDAIDPGLEPGSPLFSQGRVGSGSGFVYLRPATPGAQNSPQGLASVLDAPEFLNPSGFYAGSVVLEFEATSANTEIYYTTDGSDPDPGSGILYVAPLPISENTAIKAAAFETGFRGSEIAVATYLIDESAVIQRLPAISVVGDKENSLYMPNGVFAIEGEDYGNGGSSWRPAAVTDYNNCEMRGRAHERPVHLAMFGGGYDFSIAAGVRVAGSTFTRIRYKTDRLDEGPWQRSYWAGSSTSKRKPSMNFYFRGDYGEGKLEQSLFDGSGIDRYEKLRLRAGRNDFPSPFFRDEMMRRLYHSTGNVSAVGMFANVFVNGDFKGYFNLCETFDESFLQEAHDTEEGFDIFTVRGVQEGNDQSRLDLLAFLAGADLTDASVYAQLESMLDIDNFIEYLLVNLYGATGDWPTNNFVVAKERAPEGKFRFYMWDAEGTFGVLDEDTITEELIITNPGSKPYQFLLPVIFTYLHEAPAFRARFGDLWEKHYTGSGALTNQFIVPLYESLKDTIEPSIEDIYGDTWPIDTARFEEWFDLRAGFVETHLRAHGLIPAVASPVANIQGGPILDGTAIVLTHGHPATQIYYTLDGSDPAGAGGVLYTGPILLSSPVTDLRMRALLNDEWSISSDLEFETVWSITESLFSFDQTWRYNEDGLDLGANWVAAGFDDSAWLQGPGLLAQRNTNNGLPLIQTVLNLHGGITYYFRTEFNVLPDFERKRYLLDCHIDDGAVFYINGTEFYREFMPDGVIDYLTVANRSNNGTLLESIEIPNQLLNEGSNVLAVEVHQVRASSSDVVLGAALSRVSPHEEPPLVISEIMYHPSAADGESSSIYEFLELENTSGASLDVSGYQFVDGVDFVVAAGTVLAPGGNLVIASDAVAFETRYGFVPDGVFTGSLSNGGELLILLDATGREVFSIRYDDNEPWSSRLADGDGHSLVLLQSAPRADHTDPDRWGVSASPLGTPGVLDAASVPHLFVRWAALHGLTDLTQGADVDQDGFTDLAEFAFGSDPLSPTTADPSSSTLDTPGSGGVRIAFERNPFAEDVSVLLESSIDLTTWTVENSALDPVLEADGTESIMVPDSSPAHQTRFFRLKAVYGE